MTTDVTILMPVHAGVPPAHLRQAVASIAAQTSAPAGVVVVVDGPVSDEHLRVIAELPDVVRVDLPVNVGAGRALAAGLARCETTWVARADADDVSLPGRLESQLRVLVATGSDVCSSPMLEFEGAPEHVVGVRGCPAEHDDVARQLRLRNPLNHPTVVFRRQRAVDAGGYQHLPFREDYDLWARMLRDGSRFVGTAEPLVAYRTDGMWSRRRAPGQLAAERVLQQRLRSYGLVGRGRAARNLVVRSVYSLLPVAVMRVAYRALMRDSDRTGPRAGSGPERGRA